MRHLNMREEELAAIGAAIASNCIPCIEYHVPRAKEAGLTNAQILEAVRLADRVRRVPAGNVLKAATGLLESESETETETETEIKEECCHD